MCKSILKTTFCHSGVDRGETPETWAFIRQVEWRKRAIGGNILPSANVSLHAERVHCCNSPHSLLLWRGVNYTIDEVRIGEWACKANPFLSSFSWDRSFSAQPLQGGVRRVSPGLLSSFPTEPLGVHMH